MEVPFSGGGSKYLSDVAHVARENMKNSDDWMITDGGRVVSPNVHPPVFTSGATATVAYAENDTTAVARVVATDADMGQTVTLTLSRRADASKFSISPEGILRFKTSPDYEMPADVGGDNMYEVTITATDDHPVPMTATQVLTITVTNDVGDDETTGLEAFTEIVVYPNPVDAVLYVSGVEGNARYTLSGMEGKILKRGKLEATGTADRSVDVPSLKKGILFVTINHR